MATAPVRRPPALPASRLPASRVPAASRPLPTTAVGRDRAAHDSRVVVGLVSVFVIVAVLLVSMRIIRSTDEGRAREELGQTFAQVHEQQSDFHTVFGRFATWPELRDRGVALGPRQSVKDWNATTSHWFLSIRDVETGMICDRTGELFDEGAAERAPVCRPMR